MNNLLIVEDDPIIAGMYLTKFRSDGFQAEAAADGEAALQILSRSRPDVLLLDLLLPKVSGIEVLKQVRQQPELRALPVVVFSNAFETPLAEEAEKAGANICLDKASCTPRKVVETVVDLLNDCPAQPTAPLPEVHRDLLPEEEPGVHEEVVRAFVHQARQRLSTLRSRWQDLCRHQGTAEQTSGLIELQQRTHALTGSAAVVGYFAFARVASALEAFLKELYQQPQFLNRSTLATLGDSIDLLQTMAEDTTWARPGQPDASPDTRILVVDDEPFSRDAVQEALAVADITPQIVASLDDATHATESGEYHLFIVRLHEKNELESRWLESLRASPRHALTPILGITDIGEFESRSRSGKSAADDLIGRPYLPIELALKTLAWLIRGTRRGHRR